MVEVMKEQEPEGALEPSGRRIKTADRQLKRKKGTKIENSDTMWTQGMDKTTSGKRKRTVEEQEDTLGADGGLRNDLHMDQVQDGGSRVRPGGKKGAKILKLEGV